MFFFQIVWRGGGGGGGGGQIDCQFTVKHYKGQYSHMVSYKEHYSYYLFGQSRKDGDDILQHTLLNYL